ncbi:amidohydrolase family protein [candidate division KSB1 bacterium]|nr:amidohydrolase family protein [candidate division KSB1 bacterium]
MKNKNDLIIFNAWICQITNKGINPIFGDIKISDGKILEIREKKYSDYLSNPEISKKGFDAEGRVITVPQINFHDHFYSRLAKGLPISGSMDNFENVLKNLWWKLDLALDLEMVRASAQMAVLESIRNGVTYIIDHHASPAKTFGSLDVIKETIDKFSLRAVLCFETSDRNGEESKKQALIENLKFIKNSDNNIKGMLGLHASFTISDETLKRCSEIIKETGAGIHIHLCEDKVDRVKSVTEYGLPPVQRLQKYGLLNSKSILVHGIDLIEPDYSMVSKSGSALVYNPDSNLNNNVGLPDFNSVPNLIPILVGTDGMSANVARSMKQLFLQHRIQGNSFDESFNWTRKIYFDQLKFVKNYFPDFPSLQVGDRADFILWDYVLPTPLTKENFWGHYIYGILEYPVHSVVQNGNCLMRNFSLAIENENEIKTAISKQGRRLFEKFRKLQ